MSSVKPTLLAFSKMPVGEMKIPERRVNMVENAHKNALINAEAIKNACVNQPDPIMQPMMMVIPLKSVIFGVNRMESSGALMLGSVGFVASCRYSSSRCFFESAASAMMSK